MTRHWDLDKSGAVGTADLLSLLAAWGPASTDYVIKDLDLDADNTVGILDLLTLLANWGPCL